MDQAMVMDPVTMDQAMVMDPVTMDQAMDLVTMDPDTAITDPGIISTTVTGLISTLDTAQDSTHWGWIPTAKRESRTRFSPSQRHRPLC